MRLLVALVVLCLFSITPVAGAAVDTCVECHKKQSEVSLSRQVGEMDGDSHQRAGLSCHSCHGGDPTIGMDDVEASMDPAKGYVGIPSPADAARMCARCHADGSMMAHSARKLPTSQWLEYQNSPHGKLTLSGQKRSATCSSCHRSHGIFPISDPRSTVSHEKAPQACGRCHADPRRMTGSKLPTDQLAKYLTSVHWRAVSERKDHSAPVCHDCHGSHGAAPPGLDSVKQACGRCHSAEKQNYDRGAHVAKLGPGGCVQCHSEHAVEEAGDRLLGTGGPCLRCHNQPGPAREAAGTLFRRLAAMQTKVDQISAQLGPMALEAVPTGASEEALERGLDQLRAARRLVHTDSMKLIESQLERAEQALEASQRVADAAAAVRAKEARTSRMVAAFALLIALTLLARAALSWNDRRESRIRPTRRYQV